MNRYLVNRIAASAVTFGLVLAGTALANTDAYAERGPDSYPYCSLDPEGGTICYFDSRAQCSGAASGRCIDNPSFTGGGAMARATVRRSHKPRQ
jgi:hypothetical protein